MSDQDVVLYEVQDGIATITLNRPERRNAISIAVAKRLHELWDVVDRDPAVRVVILTGSDCGTFCAGMDLKEAAELRATTGKDVLQFMPDPSYSRIRDVTKPMIAAINGFAPAGGMMLAGNCDLRVGLAGTTLAITEVHRGRGSPWAMAALWQMPVPLLLELTLVGDPMPIERFHQVGYINYLAPTVAEVMAKARALATRIAAGAPLSVSAAKLSTLAAVDQVIGHALKEARRIHEKAYGSDDAIEGPRAFAEKRPPRWTGR